LKESLKSGSFFISAVAMCKHIPTFFYFSSETTV
jgi:hypothetical protein